MLLLRYVEKWSLVNRGAVFVVVKANPVRVVEFPYFCGALPSTYARFFNSFSPFYAMATYPEYMVAPIRQDLVEAGFEQLMTAEEVDAALTPEEGTVLVAVNSVCGCAAGKARPALKLAVASADKKPSRLVTVFAGMEADAVNKVREHLLPYPPSSPCIALFKDGELVHMIERHHIEGNDMMRIANNLQGAFEEYC